MERVFYLAKIDGRNTAFLVGFHLRKNTHRVALFMKNLCSYLTYSVNFRIFSIEWKMLLMLLDCFTLYILILSWQRLLKIAVVMIC